ncbi:hypothetical protein NBRC116594_03660 [Shimia sp. NS0008-38b]|uniref:calcium-binding protein n=1 Tax=Shimia sp. NS0008-38b TaxID=3127653 RepID=UPI003103EF50
MYLLLALLGMAGVGALVDSGSDSDTGGGTDPNPTPSEDDVAPVDDIDVTALTYDPSEEPGLEDWPIVILNDEILTPSDETDSGEPIYDLSEFDAENDRIAILEPVDHFASYDESNFDVTQTDDGDLVVSGAVLEGIDALPRGVMEVHFVEEDFVDEGDEQFSLDTSEIVASFEVVSARFGEAGDDSYRPGSGIELYALTDLEGATTLEIQGDTSVRVATGDESDTIDLSADTNGGVSGTARFDAYDNETFAFVQPDSPSGDPVSEPDVSVVQTNGGDDSVTMGARETVVIAGEGNDTIVASTTNSSYIEAGEGDDLIDVSVLEAAGFAIVQGGAGNDTFVGGAGQDVYFGGGHSGGIGGDDVAGGGGDDSLFGSTGSDVIDGGDGNDTIGGTRDFMENPPAAGSGFPNIDATDYADGSADTLIGGEGDDVVLGDAQDVMTGGAGEDAFGVYWEANASGPNDHAVISDFEVGNETLQVTVHEDDFVGPFYPEQEIALELVEVDGNTNVMFQGELLVELQGVTGVSADAVTGEVFVPYTRW